MLHHCILSLYQNGIIQQYELLLQLYIYVFIVTPYSCQSKSTHPFFCIFICFVPNMQNCTALWSQYIVVWIYSLMLKRKFPLCYIFLVPSALMILRTVDLFCLAIFMIAVCSTCGTLYNLKILFISSLKCLGSLYWHYASWLYVGCFLTDLAILDPAFCVHSPPAAALVCIVVIVASATACIIASLVFVCSLAIIHIYSFFLHLPIWDFYSWHRVVFLVLVKITLLDTYMHIYYYCMNFRVKMYLNVHMIIYTVRVHSSRLHVWCLLYVNYNVNYIMLDVLVMSVQYTSILVTLGPYTEGALYIHAHIYIFQSFSYRCQGADLHRKIMFLTIYL